MLRRLIALTVLLALASGPVLRMAVVGDYLVRFETYAAACENLARPEMQCNGSCQLSKQLKAIEDHGAPDPLSAEWLKLKIGEFTVAAPLNPKYDFWRSTDCPKWYVPATLGKTTAAFGTLVPPPKIG